MKLLPTLNVSRSGSRRSLKIILLLGVVLLLPACTYPYIAGIRILAISHDDPSVILAGGDYVNSYLSHDGGLTWEVIEYDENKFYKEFGLDSDRWSEIIYFHCIEECGFSDPNNQNISYRISAGKRFERSLDGGNTWKEEVIVPPWNQMEQNYKAKFFPRVAHQRGPFYAVTDPISGNLILSMGIEGIMVRQPGGDWQWLRMGEFHRLAPTRLAALRSINEQEWWRGFLVSLLLFLVGIRRLGFNSHRRLSVISIIFIAWLILIPFLFNALPLALIFDLLRADQAASLVVDSAGVILALIAILISGLLIIYALLFLEIERRCLMKLVGFSAAGMILYLLMFIIWSQGLFESYELAAFLSYSSVLAVLILVVRWTQKIFPTNLSAIKPTSVPWDTSSL